MNEKKYLISIAIGPVQDFIASARRSRDLWFGSWLLSELSKAAAEKVKELGGELIFPANLNGNVVNKILAIGEISNTTEFGGAIKTRLESLSKDIFDKIDKELGTDKAVFYRKKAEDQIADLIEIYWAAVPYNEDDLTLDKNGKTEYERKREQVEILLNARKATRDFRKVSWGGNVPKSSLDGQRESVIEDSAIDNPKIQKIFNLRNAERLCGVGVLKRLGEKGLASKFFSTSHVASLPFIEKVGKEIFDKYLEKIEELAEKDSGLNSEDGQVIFQERLKDFISETNLEKAKEYLKELLGDKKPSPYFALLQADGDRMGTVIDNQDSPKKHKDLSKALSKFASDVKEIVKNHNGCLIYAGGDDVLAMLPLHTFLDCIRKLAEEFAKKLNEFSDKDGNNPTLSAGIAIVHHTEPLQESLATMRNAEKEAKSVKGKNALAIILSKRSGVDTTIKGSWENDRETDKSFDERLKWFIYLHLADALPDGVAYELRDLWLRFRDETGKVLFRYRDLLKDEALRILKRKKSDSGNTNLDKAIFKQFQEIFDKVSFSDNGTIKANWTLEDLANEIIVARDLMRAYKQSGETAETFAKKHKLEEITK